MVQLDNGDWWFIIMQDRGPIGRVAHLQPVKWVDGWPMLGDNGRDLITYPKPVVRGRRNKTKTPATSDDFDTKTLGLQWQWNHNPDPTKWSLAERPGYMRLRASQADNLKQARNTLTQRVQGPSSEATVCVDVSGLKDGNTAGFGVFQFPYAYVGVTQDNGRRSIVMCNDGEIVEIIDLPLADHRIWIRARVTDRDFSALFYYSTDGINFHPIGDRLQMGLGLAWTANRFALFNFTTDAGGIGGYADFDSFHFTPR